ncbi:MAG: hypothetical protein K2H26_05010, partial [Ruminococcus sp.]|nr:hypothetical protein [Ruminococcus sp.]
LTLYGYDLEKGIVYLADPLVGNTTYPLEKFEKIYDILGKQAVVICGDAEKGLDAESKPVTKSEQNIITEAKTETTVTETETIMTEFSTETELTESEMPETAPETESETEPTEAEPEIPQPEAVEEDVTEAETEELNG